MNNIIEILISGVLLGAVYGLGALGMALIFGVMRILNLAHGAFMVLGGAVTWYLVCHSGAGLVLAVMPVMALTYMGGRMLGRWGVVTPGDGVAGATDSRDELGSHLLVTLGAALIVEDGIVRWASQGVFALPLDSRVVCVCGVKIAAFKLILLTVVLAVFAVLALVLGRSRFGRSVRACIQDRTGAVLMGVCYGDTALSVFAVGSAMAGLAGSFYLMLYPLSAHMAVPLTVKALLVVVLGGMGRIFHTLVAAMVLGLIEVFSGFVVSTQAQALVPYAGMVAVLLLRPEGIGQSGRSVRS